MLYRANIRVDLVPHGDLVGALPLAYPWLLTGARVSAQDIGELVIQLAAQRSQLWLISDTKSMKVLGAVITDIHTTDDGFKFVLMHALAGRQVWTWCRQLHEAIYQFAVGAKCSAVRFYGRQQWSRVFRDCRLTKVQREGHSLFERAIP